MPGLQEILKRASGENLGKAGVDLKASLGSLFLCSPSIEKMLIDMTKEVEQNKDVFPLPQDLVSKVHSALLYVGLDTATFHKMLLNAKSGNII